MPTADSIISDILRREGPYSNNPADRGGRTAYGISERSNPDMWINGPPTEAQARARYMQRYVVGPGFDKILDTQLQAQLVDYGVTSGPMIAIQKLQEIVHTKVDWILGPITLGLANSMHADDLNTALVIARIKMICKLVQKNPKQLIFLGGWVSRSLDFL